MPCGISRCSGRCKWASAKPNRRPIRSSHHLSVRYCASVIGSPSLGWTSSTPSIDVLAALPACQATKSGSTTLASVPSAAITPCADTWLAGLANQLSVALNSSSTVTAPPRVLCKTHPTVPNRVFPWLGEGLLIWGGSHNGSTEKGKPVLPPVAAGRRRHFALPGG